MTVEELRQILANMPWDANIEKRIQAGPRITVRLELDGPRELSIAVPNGFSTWEPDEQCAVVDRAKNELLGATVALYTRYSEDENWEQPGPHSLPCDPPHTTTPGD